MTTITTMTMTMNPGKMKTRIVLMTTLWLTIMAILAQNGTIMVLILVVNLTQWNLLQKMLVVHAKVVMMIGTLESTTQQWTQQANMTIFMSTMKKLWANHLIKNHKKTSITQSIELTAFWASFIKVLQQI